MKLGKRLAVGYAEEAEPVETVVRVVQVEMVAVEGAEVALRVGGLAVLAEPEPEPERAPREAVPAGR
ncbi:hypothetical protein [Streptomyces huiliensis]|uniref:hypothetical protein n=1 Tax=Streptomyces huiliensis TaxID=2876027 RepID=UPI001CBE4AF5|nr:hypothetical protein [Streptomyces huiliensis]MBZ4319672.1 hypothetical protein [Streptomyces huiliensis]